MFTDAQAETAPTITDTAAGSGLPLAMKIGWGAGSLGTTTMIYLQSLFVLYFFTVILGIAPGIAGTAILLAKVSDIICGVLIGRFSDKTRSSWGRRRPYLLAGALIAAGATALVFNPPVVHPAFQTLTLVLLGLGYCFFTIPYLAMPSEMTSKGTEQVELMSWRVVFSSTAELTAKAALPLIVTLAGGGAHGYQIMGLTAAAVILTPMLITFLMTAKAPVGDAASAPPAGDKPWGSLLRNRPFVLLMATKIPQSFGLYVGLASLLFFFINALGHKGTMVALWGTCSNVAAIAAIPVWYWLARRFSKKRIFFAAVLGYVVTSLSWLFATRGEPALLIATRAAIAGPFGSGLLIMSQSMLPEAIDVGTASTGVRREGTYAAAYSLIEKTCSAAGPFVVGWILQFVGLDSKAAASGQLTGEAVHALYITVAVIPAAAYGLGLIPMTFYALKRWDGGPIRLES